MPYVFQIDSYFSNFCFQKSSTSTVDTELCILFFPKRRCVELKILLIRKWYLCYAPPSNVLIVVLSPLLSESYTYARKESSSEKSAGEKSEASAEISG